MIPSSTDFIRAMEAPVKEAFIKMEIYDSEMNYIREITNRVAKDSMGVLNIDADRPVRRSFSFELNNSDNIFDWGEDKEIWIDKRIKLYTGMKTYDDNVEYIPQGVFILSSPSDQNNFDGKITKIEGYDKAYLLTDKRGKFINEQTIEEGAPIRTAIRIIAEGAGETMFNFDSVDKNVPYELTYGSGDNRWNAIEELAELAECDIFYDVHGYLTLRKIDLNGFRNEPSVWTYEYGNPREKFYAGNVRSMDESNLANHIRVLGGSGQTAIARYDLIVDEDDPLWEGSPYSIQKIGTVLYEHENGSPDPVITTDDEAKWRAKFELMRRLGYAESLRVDISPNYLHDGNDVVEIIDEENNVSGKYLLKSFSIPLSPETMTMNLIKYREVIEDWDFI